MGRGASLFETLFSYRTLLAELEAGTRVLTDAGGELLSLEARLTGLLRDAGDGIGAVLCRSGQRWYPAYIAAASAATVTLTQFPELGPGDWVELRLPATREVYEFDAQVSAVGDQWMSVQLMGAPRRQGLAFLSPDPLLSQERRNGEREMVRLKVRLGREFSAQYAENISRGGLFIRGALDHRLGDAVALTLELPGHGQWPLLAEVVHVVPSSAAGSQVPGVGLAIMSSPPEFQTVVQVFLKRLHLRRHFKVLAEEKKWGPSLTGAGYRVTALPPVRELDRVILESQGSIAAVLVPRAQAEKYTQVAEALGYGELVITGDLLSELERLLARIDALVLPL